VASIEEILLRLAAENNADEALDRLEAKLDELSHKRVNIPVRVDAEGAAAIDRLKADLDTLHNKRVDVKVDTESSGFSKLDEDAKKADSSIKGIQFHAATLPGLLAAAAPAIVPFVGELARGVLGAGALGVAAGGAAAAFGVLGYAIEYAMKHGTDATKAAVDGMKSAFDSVRSDLMSALAPAINDVARGVTSMLDSIKPAVAGLRGPFADLGNAIRTALDDPAVQGAVQQLISGFGQMVRATAPLAGPLIQAFVQLGNVLVNLATTAMPRLVPLVNEFANWLARINGDFSAGTAQTTVNHWIDAFLQLGRTVGGLLHDLSPLLQGGSAASGLLQLVGITGRLVGGFVQLLNKLGPVGQLIASGLGVALLVTRFSGLFGILGAVAGGASGLFAALRALRGGEGIGGVINALRGMTSGSNAAKLAQDALIKTKQQEKGAASEAAKADEGMNAAVRDMVPAAQGATRATGLLRDVLVNMGSSAAIAFGPKLISAITSGTAHAATAMRAGGHEITQAASQAFSGIATAVRDVQPATRSAVQTVLNNARSTVSAARGAVSTAARTAFEGVPNAARSVIPMVSGTTRQMMRAPVDYITASSAPLHAASVTTFTKGIVDSLASVASPLMQVAAGMMGQRLPGQIRAAGPLVGGASTFTFGQIYQALVSAGAHVFPLASAIPVHVSGAIRAGAGAVGSAASAMANAIRSPIASVAAGMSGIGNAIGNALASSLNAQVGAVAGAARNLANAIRSQLPSSEPKDPASPLRNLAAAGRAIVTNTIAGMDAALFASAARRVFALPGMTGPQLHMGPTPAVAHAGAHHAHNYAAPNITIRVQTLHPGDPKVMRQIGAVTAEAWRRSQSSRAPARA